MAKGNKIYGDLHYANVMPTYVGAPITELDSLGQKLEKDYETNLDLRDKLQMAANNVPARDPNYKIVQDAISRIDSDLKTHTSKGDWEYAGLAVRNAVKNFASDPLLKGVAQDKQAYDNWASALSSNKNILDSDKQYAMIKSKMENSSAVEFDATTGQYKNIFTGSSAPEYVDINKKVQEVIKDMKPSTRAMLLQRAQQSGYLQSGSIEELTDEQLKKVATDYVSSSPEAQNYIRFQAEKEVFYDRLQQNPDGSTTLRDYTPQDLMKKGLMDVQGNVKMNDVNENGTRLFTDNAGNVIDPDKINSKKYKITQDPRTGEVYFSKLDGTALQKLSPKMVVNTGLMEGVKDANGNLLSPGLYNPDGSFNSNLANDFVKGEVQKAQFNKHLDFATNFAYRKEDIKYQDDWMMKSAVDHQYRMQEIDYKAQQENQDFYVSSIMNAQEGTSTLDQSALKALYPDGTADLSQSVLAYGDEVTNKLKLNATQQKLIPFAAELANLKESLGSTFMTRLKARLTGQADLEGFGAQDDEFVDKKDAAALDRIAQILKTTGTTEKELNALLTTYNNYSSSERDAVKTLGKIMQLPQAKVNLRNTDNLKKVDGNIMIGVNAELTSDQLQLSTTEIDNLNQLFGKKIINKGTGKTTGEDGKPIATTIYNLELDIQHKPSRESQQKYNAAYGSTKQTAYNDNLFANQSLYNTESTKLNTSYKNAIGQNKQPVVAVFIAINDYFKDIPSDVLSTKTLKYNGKVQTYEQIIEDIYTYARTNSNNYTQIFNDLISLKSSLY